MSEPLDALLSQAIAAARAGHNTEARRLLIQVLKVDPRSETAWLWMSSVLDKPDERIHCLKQVLSINPENDLARKGLKALGVQVEPPRPIVEPPIEPPPPPPPAPEPTPESVSEPEPEPPTIAEVPEEQAPVEQPAYEPEPAAPVPPPQPTPSPQPTPPPQPSGGPSAPPPAPGGVPLVSSAVVAYAQNEISALLSQIAEEAEYSPLVLEWKKPIEITEQGRRKFRITPMMGAIAASVVLVVVIVLLVSRLVSMISVRVAATSATEGPPPTITPTLVDTPTPRPTRTPTPTGGPAVNEPMIPPEDAPRGDLKFGALTPTAYYIATPHRANPRMDDAILAYHEGRYADMLELLALARTTGDDTPDTYYYEAMTYFHMGDTARAGEIIETGLQLADDFAPLHIARGLIYLQQDALARAQSEFDLAKSLDPSLIDAYYYLAQGYMAEGSYTAALVEVETGRSFRKWDVSLLVTASQIYHAQRDYENAVAYANLAHYIDPSSESAALALGQGRLSLGLVDLATIGLEDYLDYNPSGAEAWALLGQAYTQTNRREDAQNAYARALQLSENMPLALYGRGMFYLEQVELEQAYEDLSAALMTLETDADVRLAHARTAFALDNYEAAQEDLEIARQQLPGNPEIETLYAQTLMQQNFTDQAMTVANQMLATGLPSAQRAPLLEIRAWAFYLEGDFENALTDINAAIEIAGTGTRRYYRGRILQAVENIPEAIRDLEWVLAWTEVYNYDFADEAAAQLTILIELQNQEEPSP